MIEPPEVPASDAKNGFGRILERVAREGGVTINRHHYHRVKPRASRSCLSLTRTLRPTRRSQSLLSNMFDTILCMLR
jgi:hypothetical protein